MAFVMILFFFFLGAIEWFAYQSLRTLLQRKKILVAYQIFSFVLAAFFLYTISQFDRSVGQTRQTMLVLAAALLVYIPKMVLSIVMIVEDFFRVGKGSVTYLAKKKRDQPFIAS